MMMMMMMSLWQSCSRRMIWCKFEPKTAALVATIFLWIFLRIKVVLMCLCTKRVRSEQYKSGKTHHVSKK